ncbi:MAG: hypothetical protein E6K35_04240 [Gammaproteobacteria bacterium]|nr:MAG: hypothetical protein E6K35_04240 [Gammaproteobacteria bacterium]
MMTVVCTRGSRCSARTLAALALGFTAPLAGCGNSTSLTLGTPVITLSHTGSDFAAYRVAIDSITLTDSHGAIVPLIAQQTTSESVDLATPTDLTELLGAPALPAATYKSATLTLDYTSASIWVNVNGQAVAATPVSSTGTALTTATLTITFDPNHPLVIAHGASTHLAIAFDLAASNSINTATTPPTVTVRPFVVMTPAPADATVIRVRGPLVTVQSASSDYVINVRPLTDLQTTPYGAVTVSTDAQTYFNINGVAYTGAAGLAAMASLTENTATAAYGTLGDLSGITPGFHATAVYAGTGLESPAADHISGVVGARSGNTLTVHGATFLTPGISSYTASYANNATVTVGSATVVSEDGVAASGLTPAAISVGQQLVVSGLGSVDSAGNISLDATACSSAPPCQVRLIPTRLWGTLNSATPGSALLDVLTLGNFAPADFNFAGTGAAGQDANPSAYALNTGSLDESAIAAGTLLQVDGIVNAFGSAPPDFTATAITAGTATEQRLVVEWINGAGATAPFISASSSGLVVKLSNAALGTIHEIRTGPAGPANTGPGVRDLTLLPTSPPFTIVGAAQADLRLAIGSASLSTGVSVFNSIGGFATALSATFKGTNKIYRLVAVGQYNNGANTFVASRISVALM